MTATIVLLGGGTAGHIMPNIALLPELGKRFDRILYVGSPDSMEEQLCRSRNIPFYPTETMKFHRRGILKNLRLPIVLSRGINEAKEILRREKADVVFSKGGYAAVPTVLAARRLKIPVCCHESDRTVGLANRLTARFSARFYTAFPDTRPDAIVLPTPVREEIFEGRKLRLFLDENKPVLLFMGGSLGAEAINDVLSESYADLSYKYNILHITGRGEPIRTASYRAVPFTDRIADYFATADLVISRAGASTLGELTALGKRVIAIPLPKGESRGDQEENAAYYMRRGSVRVLPQSALSAETLTEAIADIIKKRPPAPAYDRRTPEILARDLYEVATGLRPQTRERT